MKRVVETKQGTHVIESSRGVTISLEWICTLSCGHVERRVRSTAPERLKCAKCEPYANYWERD